jgi:hypothetical protein
MLVMVLDMALRLKTGTVGVEVVSCGMRSDEVGEGTTPGLEWDGGREAVEAEGKRDRCYTRNRDAVFFLRAPQDQPSLHVMYLGGREWCMGFFGMTQQLGNDYSSATDTFSTCRSRGSWWMSVPGSRRRRKVSESKSPAHQQMRRVEVDPICVIAA